MACAPSRSKPLMMSPGNRSILITGCSSGIGYACALGLPKRGWLVIASARKAEDVARLKLEGLTAVQLDLDDPSLHRLRSRADPGHHGRTARRTLQQRRLRTAGRGGGSEPETLRAQLETNLLGWHDLTCRVIPIMRRQGQGRIVQNSSILGFIPLPYRGAYVASKFALEGLTDTLRLELRGSGISVSLIEPGPILSRFRENAYRAFKANIDTEHSVHHDAYAVRSSDSPRQAPRNPSRSRPRPCSRNSSMPWKAHTRGFAMR
jgi:NAD(P)-dependent dehydrogenase (short-subunit alcohol dehydrogenase family)